MKPKYLLIPFGGLAYGLIEIMYRGHTHWTMLILGGICFYLIGELGIKIKKPLYWTAVPCAYLITGLEFLTGCVVNLGLGWNVWDYSGQPMNVLGQISLSFLGMWYVLSMLALPFAKVMLQTLQKLPQ